MIQYHCQMRLTGKAMKPDTVSLVPAVSVSVDVTDTAPSVTVPVQSYVLYINFTTNFNHYPDHE